MFFSISVLIIRLLLKLSSPLNTKKRERKLAVYKKCFKKLAVSTVQCIDEGAQTGNGLLASFPARSLSVLLPDPAFIINLVYNHPESES